MEKRELFSGLLILFLSYLYIDHLKTEERPLKKVENGVLRGLLLVTSGYSRVYEAYFGIPYAQKRGSPALPVMVFFHGGYWHFGSASDHGENRFMEEEVILVTVNYRLGALGFLSTGDETVRGNSGLKDQTMALKWISRNICNFGGDPNRVTIFGESVGGVSTNLHILSPASKGLFHRAISQSGTALNVFAINPDGKTQAMRFAAKFSCPTNDSLEMVNCLKRLDASSIVSAHKEASDFFNRNHQSMFAATIEAIKDDTAFLVEDPIETLRNGNFPKIPLILGVNANEGLLASSIFVNTTKQKLLKHEWKSSLPAYLWTNAKNEEITHRIRNYYFNPNVSMSQAQFNENVSQALSDRAFFHPASKTARLYAAHAKTYLYYFNHSTHHTILDFLTKAESSLFHPTLDFFFVSLWQIVKEFVLGIEVRGAGVCHGDELPLLFTLPWLPNFMSWIPKRDVYVSKNMIRLWTSFAKQWDSLIFENVEWIAVRNSSTTLRYLEISSTPKMIDEPFEESVKFWDSIGV